jgi:hypothetical protein
VRGGRGKRELTPELRKNVDLMAPEPRRQAGRGEVAYKGAIKQAEPARGRGRGVGYGPQKERR